VLGFRRTNRTNRTRNEHFAASDVVSYDSVRRFARAETVIATGDEEESPGSPLVEPGTQYIPGIAVIET
jgi:hypothetical protein